jgi:hypothetical protein
MSSNSRSQKDVHGGKDEGARGLWATQEAAERRGEVAEE